MAEQLKTFKELFPSLKGKRFRSEKEIMEFCVDKKRLKDAIKKVKQDLEGEKYDGEETVNVLIDLEKELEL